MADHNTIIRNSVCLCVLANRIIKWTMIHHRRVMGIRTFSSTAPHYPSLSFYVFISAEFSFLSLFDLHTECHSLKLAVTHRQTVILNFFVSVSISVSDSLFSLAPLSFCLSLCISLSPLLSLLLTSPTSLCWGFHPSSSAYIHSICLSPQHLSAFPLFPLLPLSMPLLPFHSLALLIIILQ